ncbi:MAG TPA: histidine--tRNA ligase [Symbiobacteriaceae bacterium]|nr:histidine--tRNA ligase [Symbiobacteriaceae bacterium]
MEMQAPKGMNDFLPGESWGWKDSYRWEKLEAVFRDFARRFGYQEVRVPLIEYLDVFARGIGEATDAVSKEMFNITPRGDAEDARAMALRPELTAGLVRAFLENGLHNGPAPMKLFTFGPAFRYENVQKGRFRQFHQLDVEVFGAQDPAIDAEVIKLGLDVVASFGLTGLVANVNSIGCPVCRPKYRQALQDHFRPHLAELCSDCNVRFEKNPLRLVDCKKDARHPAMQNAPIPLDYLCEECQAHWDGLLAHLTALGVQYQIDPRIVRGLDYYTKTVFEILHPKLGAQSTLWGGGRYDGLIETLGGKPTPGVGFGMGMERILMVLEEEGLLEAFADRPKLDVFVVTMGDLARPVGVKMVYELRAAGLSADLDYLGRSMKAQMKYAGKQEAPWVVILGENEVQAGKALLKRMDTGEQVEVPLDGVVAAVRG